MNHFATKNKQYRAIVLAVSILTGASLISGCMSNTDTASENLASTTTNRIDLIRGDAPELAAYGDLNVGVRTLEFVNPNQVNVPAIDTTKALPASLPTYDRPITVEVWYPANQNATGSHIIPAMMRNGEMVTLQGKAFQDAEPNKTDRYPLVLMSHGFPGNRHLFTPIAENIASKGYVVVSIDHVESTYNTLGTNGLYSALVNRPTDQLFVLNKIAELSNSDTSFLNGLVDTDNTALIGYSMGGYGTLVTIGAGVNQATVEQNPLTEKYLKDNNSYAAMVDPRIKTAVAFAPAGTKQGWISNDALADIKIPVLFIAGSVDPTVGYENGVRTTWENTTSVDRSLLTFLGAGHNVGAPMPAPQEAYKFDDKFNMNLSDHYLDAVWDNRRLNNISQHFITAWLGKQLKSQQQMNPYLNLTVESDDTWTGFPKGKALSMTFEQLHAGQ